MPSLMMDVMDTAPLASKRRRDGSVSAFGASGPCDMTPAASLTYRASSGAVLLFCLCQPTIRVSAFTSNPINSGNPAMSTLERSGNGSRVHLRPSWIRADRQLSTKIDGQLGGGDDDGIDEEFDGFLDKIAEDPRTAAVAESIAGEEMQQRMEKQQKQIDLLMKMVQHGPASTSESKSASELKSASSRSSKGGTLNLVPSQAEYNPQSDSSFASSAPPSQGEASVNVAPLKTMLFIDGTWLYYSINRRDEFCCPIMQRYGKYWQRKYRFKWEELPRVICEAMMEQQLSMGWSSNTGGGNNDSVRPVEIVRACVFTSYKKNTDKNTLRVQMFEEMAEANYDVHIMETVGGGEKCIDIQLAVEMLHFATVPNAYDVGLLLSGDKDFLPALMRTRQKGKKVGIVSMRRGCNSALLDTPNIRDYDLVWIEDYIERLIEPIPEEDAAQKRLSACVSTYTVAKLIRDLIKMYPDEHGEISSRFVGRGLKQLRLDGTNVLAETKRVYGGLRNFVSSEAPSIFEVNERYDHSDKSSNEFWLGYDDERSELALAEMGKAANFTEVEKHFLKEYLSGKQKFDVVDGEGYEQPSPPPREKPFITPLELTEDYSEFTVVKLKDACRSRGLPVSGTKAVLLERIQEDVEAEISLLRQRHEEAIKSTAAARPVIRPRATVFLNNRGGLEHFDKIDPEVTKHIAGLIEEYIHARGGTAGSRDVGRYLASSAASTVAGEDSEGQRRRVTALVELKETYGSLANYVMANEERFSKGRQDLSEKGKQYGFPIWVRGSGPSDD